MPKAALQKFQPIGFTKVILLCTCTCISVLFTLYRLETILLPKKYLTRREKSGITFEEVPERFTHNLRNNHIANIELSKQTNAPSGRSVEIP